MAKHHQIIGSATSLLGISLVIITGLHVSHAAVSTYADEVASVAAVALSISVFTSYLAVRAEPADSRFSDVADKFFIVGMVLLFGAVLVYAIGDA